MEEVGTDHLGDREDPLGVTDRLEDLLAQQGGEDRGPLGGAGGTEPAPFAREGHDPVVTAGVAVDPDEAVGQDAALQETAELALDEAGHGSAFAGGPEAERLEVFPDDLVKDRGLGEGGVSLSRKFCSLLLSCSLRIGQHALVH